MVYERLLSNIGGMPEVWVNRMVGGAIKIANFIYLHNLI